MYIPEYAREHYRQTRGSDVQEVNRSNYYYINNCTEEDFHILADNLYALCLQLIEEEAASHRMLENACLQSCGNTINTIASMYANEVLVSSGNMRIVACEIENIVCEMALSYGINM